MRAARPRPPGRSLEAVSNASPRGMVVTARRLRVAWTEFGLLAGCGTTRSIRCLDGPTHVRRVRDRDNPRRQRGKAEDLVFRGRYTHEHSCEGCHFTKGRLLCI